MYKPIESLTDNTLCEAREKDGKVVSYRISPAEGYKLHHKTYDMPITENGIKTNKIKRGYTTRFITMGVNYNWETNPKQIYAIPINEEEEIIAVEENPIEKEDTSSELEEKAKAYDIIMGVDE